MSYKFIPTARFQKETKRLVRKFSSLQDEPIELRNNLLEQPIQGSALGHSCYKIRLAIESKGKGKSGGARVITYIYVEGKTVYLLSIYDKSEQDDISEKELLSMLHNL